MNHHKLTVLSIFLILFSSGVFAQEDYYHPELEWKTIETEHFFINYHEGVERTANVVARIAEDIYGPVTSLYNHEPDQKVSFVLKDYDDYSNGAAYFFNNKIEIWAPALDFDLRGTHNWLRNVITHEFTHIIQIQVSMKFGRKFPGIYIQWLGYESERRTDVLYGYPNVLVSYPLSGVVVPSWFAEGVSQYNRHDLRYDFWDSHRDMILRMYSLDGNMLSWNEMAVFGKTSLGNESSYNAGFAFVQYIADRYGIEKIPEIARNLSTLTEVTIDGAIKRAIGKDGEEVYNEWREHLKQDYAERTKAIRAALPALDTIAFVGFGNFYPTFSPDGTQLAYISNKQSDYFGRSGIYLYDLATKTEKTLQAGVRSQLAWSPDGSRLYYSKITRENPHWSDISDLYVYDRNAEEETRLTFGVRASSPAVSPDGKTIAYIAGKDGTLNLFKVNADGTDRTQLTNYYNGEQVFHPHWSPDGTSILFDYAIRDGRDVAMIPASGGTVTFLVQTSADERNAIYTPDGKSIIYASDKTGIFNLYRRDRTTGKEDQLTNVLGGAFMPTINAKGQLIFACYTSTGYKIMSVKEAMPVQNTAAYVKLEEAPPSDGIATADTSKTGLKQYNFKALRSFNDADLTPLPAKDYSNIAMSVSFIPFLRVDNYNPKNKGIEVIKPGVYLFSYDVLERIGFIAGAAMNSKLERDLFFTFDYRGKIPGLYQLGMEPAVSLELFNITRDAEATLQAADTLPVDVSYNLLEGDIAFKQKFLTEALDLELRFAHSRYTGSIGSLVLHDNNNRPFVAQASDNLYYIGNDASAKFLYNGVIPSSTMDINPVGRKIKIRYDFEFSKFNPDNNYTIENGMLVPKYDHPKFHRLEIDWKEYIPLPGWRHTLTLEAHHGTIFGPPVDNFFNFYIGGLAGMKGYPFYSLGGNEFLYGNVTYRFPISDRIDVRFLQFSFNRLYAAVYSDVGNAWMSGGMSGKKFKRDLGVELRLEAFSYYMFPTRIFFNATYGQDRFDYTMSSTAAKVTYGKEWQYHFGILFGFDLD